MVGGSPFEKHVARIQPDFFTVRKVFMNFGINGGFGKELPAQTNTTCRTLSDILIAVEGSFMAQDRMFWKPLINTAKQTVVRADSENKSECFISSKKPLIFVLEQERSFVSMAKQRACVEVGVGCLTMVLNLDHEKNTGFQIIFPAKDFFCRDPLQTPSWR